MYYEEDQDEITLLRLYKKAYTEADITNEDIEIEDIDRYHQFYLVNIPKIGLKEVAVILGMVPDDAGEMITDLVDRIKENLGDDFEFTNVHIWTTSAYKDILERIIDEKGFENVIVESMDELLPTIKRQIIPKKRDIMVEKRTKRANEAVEERIKREKEVTQSPVMVPVDVLNKVLDTQKSLAETLDRIAHLLEKIVGKEGVEAGYTAVRSSQDARRQEAVQRPAFEAVRTSEKVVVRKEEQRKAELSYTVEEKVVEPPVPQKAGGADEFIDEYLTDNPWAEILSRKVRKDEGKNS